ncbi:YbaN family protein [Stenotrophomonas sp. YIM B06876]|uniref:YbaN family protein n=1 Tax=Stenotrophomonas sp. YIM B06876 TaxID=3060211 RepID=UPI0027391C1A|nr:YbaN family protein [Stenotrophomonas sp. YIM B06876]
MSSDPLPVPAPRIVRFRWAWWLLAYASLGIGIVGIFVPGLPTTVFILVSAWAASHGSERLHRWLLAHRQFGPMIADWQAHGAVSRKAKWMATATMLLCAAVMLWCVPLAWLKWLSIASMATVAIWLWSRPLPPAAG